MAGSEAAGGEAGLLREREGFRVLTGGARPPELGVAHGKWGLLCDQFERISLSLGDSEFEAGRKIFFRIWQSLTKP